MAQSVERPTLDFASGHDTVVRSSPSQVLHWQRRACLGFSLFPSAPLPALSHFLTHTKQIIIKKKKKRKTLLARLACSIKKKIGGHDNYNGVRETSGWRAMSAI